MESSSNTPGTIALVLGVLNLVAAGVSLVLALGGGMLSFCCGLIGMATAIIPFVAGLFGLVGMLWSFIVWRRPSMGVDDKNGTYGMIGLVLCLLSIVGDVIAALIALGPTILAFCLVILNAIVGG